MKKRQNKSKKLFFIFVFLLCFGLMFISGRKIKAVETGESAIQKVFGPVNGIFYKGYTWIQGGISSLLGTGEMRKEYNSLKEENAKLREQVALLENLKAQQSFLEGEYMLMTRYKEHLIGANVTAKGAGNLFIRFTIDKGEDDGIKVGDIVIQGIKISEETVLQGVVGKIIETGSNWAKVSSILDEANNISFKISRTNDYGIINGRTEKELEGYLFNRDGNVLVGDYVLTSGLGGTYPANLFLGEIVNVDQQSDNLTKKIMMKSSINFNGLSRVFVFSKDALKTNILPEKNDANELKIQNTTGEESLPITSNHGE